MSANKPSSSNKKPRKVSRNASNSTQTTISQKTGAAARNAHNPTRRNHDKKLAESNMHFGGPDTNMERKRPHQSVSFDHNLASIASNGDSANNDNKRLHHQLSAVVGEGNNDDGDQMTEVTHRSLVEAVYEVGLKHASPSVILEMMTENHKAVTTERVKSHLQKYRNNKEKSKLEFMNEYDAWMQKALTVGAAGGTFSRLASPQAVLEMVGSSGGSDKLLGGDLPAYLSYSVMQEDSELKTAAGLQQQQQQQKQQSQLSPSTIRSSSNEFAKHFVGAKIPFPVLTEEERTTPLGVSIGHVMALFHSMTQHLMRERIAREIVEAAVAGAANASVNAAAAARSESSQHSVRFAQPPWEQQQQQQQCFPTQQAPHFQPSYDFVFRLGDSLYSEQAQNGAQATAEQQQQQHYHQQQQMPASVAQQQQQQRDFLVVPQQQADEDYNDGGQQQQQQPKAPSSSSADEQQHSLTSTTGHA